MESHAQIASNMPFVENPYINRGPIHSQDSFYGRKRQLGVLMGARAGLGISVVGERRVGKSSLLYAIKRAVTSKSQRLCFVYLDLQFVAGCATEEFHRFLFESILAETKLSDIKMEPLISATLSHAVRRLSANGTSLVLLMDEVDVLIQNPKLDANVFAQLRSAHQPSPRELPDFPTAVGFVLAFQEGLQIAVDAGHAGSAFLNMFSPLYVGPFTRDEAQEAIREPARKAGRPFNPKEESWILDLAGHHPFYLQVACYHMFNLKLFEPNSPDLYRRLTQEFEFEISPFLEHMWNRLTKNQRSIVLAKLGKEPLAESPETGNLMEKLRQMGVLIQDDKGERIFSSSFIRFIKENIEKPISRSAVSSR